MKLRIILVMALGVAGAVPGFSQWDFTVDGRDVQIHSFASQGFFYSNDNNYLTMNTSQGSFAFTDFGANIGVNITDKLRVGAQIYDRNVGHLGTWHPDLDWAIGDYKFKDWFGVRAGKVKTVLGLYNDTQDLEFLSTWALMPQSVYPVDSRGDTIAHIGADLYGNISAKRLGSFAYTIYGGKRPDDPYGGYVYSLDTTQGGQTSSLPTNRAVNSYGGPVYGSDLRWTTPLKGFVAGVSLLRENITTKGYFIANNEPYLRRTLSDKMPAYYAQYVWGNLHFDGEYRREIKETNGTSITGKWNSPPQTYDIRMGYLSVAYRINKRFEVGTYHSRYYPNWITPFRGLPANHLFDQAVTLRVDLTNYLDFKIEGHFDSGAPEGNATRGFYAQNNPNGVQPSMNLFVMRLGYHL